MKLAFAVLAAVLAAAVPAHADSLPLARSHLAQELGVPDEALELELDAGSARALAELPQPVTLRGVTATARARRFVAEAVPLEGPGVRLTGEIHHRLEVLTANRIIQSGENLSPGDASMLWVRSDARTRDSLTSQSDVIGARARRTIAPGQPIRTTDLQWPILVERNSSVTLTVPLPTGSIETTARALDAGSRGDSIRVQAQGSGRPVTAVVSGPGSVIVP